ncbi:hypothetical protein [Bordetella genomosp. 7]|uniref:Uncharacterized protein n=1 Tax=Bordetella genomosp. 7 TaxID=1416805 RepID=A0A261QYU1_9BORD|nr:hypothetical protein [Bordetella genomosp. 7]OZI17945.1 hypothetical protein CAL19_12755 [Bordetella genomosp. 7]
MSRGRFPILAIDPGTTESGYCVLMGGAVDIAGIRRNTDVLSYLQRDHWQVNGYALSIEMVASYGMPVGREVFETVRWIGRFQQAWYDPDAVRLVYRQDVKLHLCRSLKARDSHVRQAVLDRFSSTGGGKTPQVGTKKQPGPLYGVSSHAMSALAVAIYSSEVVHEH